MFDSLIIRVVDDDESIRYDVKRSFGTKRLELRYLLQCRRNATRRCHIRSPSCVTVLDLKMEGMSGLEASD